MITKEYDVTIPLERYEELLKVECWFDDLRGSIQILVNNAELSWDEKELDFSKDDIKDLVKKYDIQFYKSKIKALKKEKETNE